VTQLSKQQLGRTDMEITRVGLGSWAIGGSGWGFGWGAQDDKDSVATIHSAIEHGINWIDTAAIYGYGHSEDVVGRALSGISHGDRPYVFTKCGIEPNGVDPMAPNIRSGKPDSIRKVVDESLGRLRVDRIDLCQMHWPPPDTGVEEYWTTLLELREAGKVAAVGLSNHDVAQLEEAEALGHVDSVQPPFSLIRREAAQAVIPWCAAHGCGVIVYSPMQAGLLTGVFSAERAQALPKDDWRRNDPEFRPPNLAANLALAAALSPIAKKHETTVAAAAIAWTLAFEGVSGAIVGARRAEQIDAWTGAATLVLDEDDLAAIAAALAETGAGSGPRSPDESK
jgi:aryl-alcohol dehydrogenase-like predicted oxidoreductase